MKKVVLAFSGGLDTSFSVPYLMEQGFEVVTVTVDTGGFSAAELKEIAVKSKTLGAKKHFTVDGKKIMYGDIVSYIIKTNGLYQGSYPNMCADRYVIAAKALKIAQQEDTQAVAHGSSAMGNDQVRFDVALMTLNPDMHIISPIKEIGGNRANEQAFLEKKGFQVSALHKKYSVNQNILGVTYSGSEIDSVQEPDGAMFQWTKIQKQQPEYAEVEFEKGLPVGFNGKSMGGEQILQRLNRLAGAHGFGKGYYTGDCVIGIKGHIVFEAPGILSLIAAHKALEQLTLTKAQQNLGPMISQEFTELLYNGKYFEAAVADLKAFIDSQQQFVTGKVTLKLETNQVLAVEVQSPFSLINSKVATYAQGCSWKAVEADGFIKLYGLQGKIAASIHQKKQSKQEEI